MKMHYLFELEVCNKGCIIGGMACYEVGHFREPVRPYHDGVFMPLGPWQTRDEVQAPILLRALRDEEGV